MWVQKLLALLLCAVCFILCTESPMWEYHFVNKNLTWSEAQQFCRQHYHDLACVSSSEDNLRLPRPPGYSAPVWIGLYDDPTDLSQWKWTASNSNASFMMWFPDEPRYIHEDQQCAIIISTVWMTVSCSSEQQVLCFSGSNPKVFHATSQDNLMSWNDALTFCKTNYTDLAMIESTEENTAAETALGFGLAWLGLIRSGGQWSDNRPLTFSNWSNPGERNYNNNPFCVSENVNNSWDASSCVEKRPFYCQAPTARRFVKIKFSGHDLGASVINQDVLEKIQKRFEAAGHPDVKIKWKTAPEKQEEKKDKAVDCPHHK